MRRTLLALGAAAALLAPITSAPAAIPAAGPFAGKTSLKGVNGFPDVITFVAAKNGKSLTRFTFGTLGCFGTGAFPAGVDPYAMAESVGRVESIPLAANGAFSVNIEPSFAATDGVVTRATIKGTVANRSSVTGTISISQASNGDACGPSTMKFSAVPGTPESLGLTGP